MNKTCSSEIYIENSKYKTHKRIIKTNIRASSKKVTSKKVITAFFKKKSSKKDYKYVQLSDINLKNESPPISLEHFKKIIIQENRLKNLQEVKKIISQNKNKSFSLSTKELIDFSSSAWEKKNFWYLIKRELGLTLDTAWYYSRNYMNTVLQRRFNKNLRNIETIDVIFHDEIPIENFKNLVWDFRISNSDKNLKVLSIEGNLVIRDDYKIKRTFKTLRKKYIQFDIGDIVRYAYKDVGTANLKEIIMLLPKSLTEIPRIRPVKSIRFNKRRSPQVLSKTEFSSLMKEKLTKHTFGKPNYITHIKRNTLNIEYLNAKLPKWIPR